MVSSRVGSRERPSDPLGVCGGLSSRVDFCVISALSSGWATARGGVVCSLGVLVACTLAKLVCLSGPAFVEKSLVLCCCG